MTAIAGGRGADASFEVIGLGATMEQAINMTRAGGEVILVGVPRMDVMLNLNAAFTWLYLAKTIKGCMYGSANFKVDFPMYLDLYKAGKLDLDRLITKTYTLDEAPAAFEDMEKGRNARGVIVHA